MYPLPVSGSSHPNGSTTDFAYIFYDPRPKSACVAASGTLGGVRTTTTIIYFNLFRQISLGWTNDARTEYYFALDGQTHYACWGNLPGGIAMAVGWEEIRYRVNNNQATINYTEYAQ